MTHPTPDAPEPSAVPSALVTIEINRESERVVTHDAEIHYSSPESPPAIHLPQQVRWVVRSGLLPDEMVIVFGKPLEWSGPVGPPPERLPLVENAFAGPLALGRTCPERLSGAPRFAFPEGEQTVAWSYGVVVLRGRDKPLTAHPLVKIHRAP